MDPMKDRRTAAQHPGDPVEYEDGHWLYEALAHEWWMMVARVVDDWDVALFLLAACSLAVWAVTTA